MIDIRKRANQFADSYVDGVGFHSKWIVTYPKNFYVYAKLDMETIVLVRERE